jgi:hypothetical protein
MCPIFALFKIRS